MRVVFDTNIYISAFAIPGGMAEEAYLSAILGKFELLTSIPILTETARVLQTKFDWSEDKTHALMQAIARVAAVVKPVMTLDILEDEPDNRILECANEAQADLIVTGDRHLLALKTYQGVKLTSLAEFLRMMESAESPEK